MNFSPITLTPQKHRFFNQLAAAQAATVAYGLSQMSLPTRSKLPHFGAAVSQLCHTQAVEVVFQGDEVLAPFARQSWPTEIHLTFQTRGNPPPKSASPTAVQLLMASFYEHAFITYYEKNCDSIRAKYGKTKQWPGILNFGRIVRNAFAHNGEINIVDPAEKVSWGNLSYSMNDNGRRVLYNDLTSGDLTLLLIEMDSAF